MNILKLFLLKSLASVNFFSSFLLLQQASNFLAPFANCSYNLFAKILAAKNHTPPRISHPISRATIGRKRDKTYELILNINQISNLGTPKKIAVITTAFTIEKFAEVTRVFGKGCFQLKLRWVGQALPLIREIPERYCERPSTLTSSHTEIGRPEHISAVHLSPLKNTNENLKLFIELHRDLPRRQYLTCETKLHEHF